ncbi:hypothetical protein OROMI_028492 [Orobanche minor]
MYYFHMYKVDAFGIPKIVSRTSGVLSKVYPALQEYSVKYFKNQRNDTYMLPSAASVGIQSHNDSLGVSMMEEEEFDLQLTVAIDRIFDFYCQFDESRLDLSASSPPPSPVLASLMAASTTDHTTDQQPTPINGFQTTHAQHMHLRVLCHQSPPVASPAINVPTEQHRAPPHVWLALHCLVAKKMIQQLMRLLFPLLP